MTRPNKYDRTYTPARLWIKMIRDCREVSAPGHRWTRLRGLTAEQVWDRVRGWDTGTIFESRMRRCMSLLGREP